MADQSSYFDPSDPDNFGDMSRYNSPNPMLEKLLDILGNFSRTPRASGGQDAYGEFMRREFDRNMIMNVQRNAATNNAATQFFGINAHNPMVQGLGAMFGDPYGGYGQAMKMLTGSNPILADSRYYAQGQGASMGAFGRIGHVGTGELEQARNDFLASSFYNHRTINDDYVKNLQNSIAQQSSNFTKNNPNIAAAYGLNPGQSASAGTSLLSSRVSDEQLNQLQIATNAMQKAGNDKDKLQKIADTFAKNAGSTLDKIVDEYKSKNGGVVDAGILQRVSHDLMTNGITSAAYGLANLPKAGSKIFGGVDYAISRGYGEEQIASMFGRASQLQMLGRDSYLGARKNLGEGYLMNAASAFRPIGKAMGMNEIDAMNELLGPEAANINSDKGAEKVAKLGRDVTAVSRVAGVGIKSLISMVNTMKDLAAQYPELAYMGSNITQMVLTETKRAQALNAAMSPEQSRMAGGVQGILNQGLSVAANSLTSNAGKLVGNSMLLAQQKGVDIQPELDAWAKSSHNGTELNNFATKVSGKLGISSHIFMDTISNQDLTAEATTDPKRMAAMREATLDSTRALLNQRLAQSHLSVQDLQTQYNKDPHSLPSFIALHNGTPAIGELINTPNVQQVLREGTPDYQKNLEITNRMADLASKESQNWDIQHADQYATTLQAIINPFVGGNIHNAQQALNAGRNVLISPSVPQSQANLNALDTFIQAGRNKGGTNAGDVVKLFGTLGIGKSLDGKSEAAKEAVYTKLRNVLSFGDKASRDAAIEKDPDLKALVADNPHLTNDKFVKDVQANPDDFRAFAHQARYVMTDQQKGDAIREKARINNTAMSDILSKAGITGDAASKVIAASLAKHGEIQDVDKTLLNDAQKQTLTDAGANELARKSYNDSQGNDDDNDSGDDDQTDFMKKIIESVNKLGECINHLTNAIPTTS